MPDLIDLIYEAAFVPDCWEEVLQQASDISASASAQVFFVNERSAPNGTTLPNMRPLFDEFIKGDAWSFCDSLRRMCELQPASFVHVDDFLTPEEIERDPARIMLREIGIGAHLCAAISLPTGEIAVFVFQKWARDGGYARAEIDRLDLLRPHLARASLISSRLQFERAQAVVSALQAMGLPGAVARNGALTAMNVRFEAMFETLFVLRAFNRISVVDRFANALFQAALDDCGRPSAPPLVMSIPVRATDDEPPHVIHVVPLRRSARDIFAGADLLLVVNRIEMSAGLPSDCLVKALFDLTPAEARLAHHLASGQSLATAASAFGLSSSSARTYLARIFSKTGTHSQHELVALLRSAGSLGAPDR